MSKNINDIASQVFSAATAVHVLPDQNAIEILVVVPEAVWKALNNTSRLKAVVGQRAVEAVEHELTKRKSNQEGGA